MWLIASTSLAFASPAPSRSAEITTGKVDGINVIHLNGPIVAEDVDRFASIATTLSGRFDQRTVVILNSPGGEVLPGLAIGETIRSGGFATGVGNDMQCTSVCALIWLAGIERYIGSAGKIGFHAAYTGLGDDKKESGQANAFIGAYLSKLGLSYKAIAFITSAAPSEIQWLHPEDANQIGIRVRLIPDAEPVRPKPEPSPSVASPSVDGTPAERQAKNLVLDYYTYWSKSGTEVDALARYYGDATLYYGARRAREQIMVEKRNFSARWPVRRYTIRTPTLFAQCSDTCSVSGVVEWDVSSPERNAHSVGSANFVLKVALDTSGTGGIIMSENGSVLSAHNDAIPNAQASTDPTPSSAYASGRQARVDYEAWFAGLPEGDYQQGAAFWAMNRSVKVPPSCSQPTTSAAWQSGCLAARQRLTPTDLRRRTEVDFKLGWNSL